MIPGAKSCRERNRKGKAAKQHVDLRFPFIDPADAKDASNSDPETILTAIFEIGLHFV
jgi:hypothetical protein